jgi:hypothetical protein
MLLESHLKLLLDRQTKFVGSKCLNFAIKYVSAATKIKQTMDKLKPFMDRIMYQSVVPIMLVTERDVSLF